MNVHQEWFFADELERAAQAAPDTTFVWAHGGHGPPEVVGGVLRRNRNVMIDISARTPWIGPGTVLLRADGSLNAAWAMLLEDYADRVMVGLDVFAPAHYQQSNVTMLVDYYRGISGEHPDWDEYRRAMEQQRRVLLRISIEAVGPDRGG